jgi:hypothetical protein
MAQLIPMKIRNSIVPEFSTDNFPVTHINLVQGSPHIVNTIQERNNIPNEHRTQGMIITVLDGGPKPYSQYRLENGIYNTNWVLYKAEKEIALIEGTGIYITVSTTDTKDSYTINTKHTDDINNIFNRLNNLEIFVNNYTTGNSTDITNIQNDIITINGKIDDLLARVIALETHVIELLTTIVNINPRSI